MTSNSSTVSDDVATFAGCLRWWLRQLAIDLAQLRGDVVKSPNGPANLVLNDQVSADLRRGQRHIRVLEAFRFVGHHYVLSHLNDDEVHSDCGRKYDLGVSAT